jgi:hypothetical protein
MSLGYLTLDRSAVHNRVDTSIATDAAFEQLIIALISGRMPVWVECWKTRFYRIAMGAGVLICLIYFDFSKRQGGLGYLIYPSGNTQADRTRIELFYRTVASK